MIINKTSKIFLKYFFLIVCSIASCKTIKNSVKEPEDYFVVSEKKTEIKPINKKPNYKESEFSENIKSLKIGKQNISTGEPSFNLNSDDNIKIEFDLLSKNIISLQYQLIHCDMNWNESNLMDMEYIEGFSTDYIENFSISNGPIQHYIHYEIEIPNNNLKFIKSGNYILKIFDENTPDSSLVSAKLFVSEQSSNLDFVIQKTNDMDERKYHQIYDVSCTYNPQNISDPYTNIFINVQQNHQEFDEHWLNGPDFIRENKLVFIADEERFFDGSNEFRFFEMSTFNHKSENIDKIIYDNNNYHIILKKDFKRSYRQYLEYKDLDGKYFSRTFDNDDVKTEGEYAYVNFELPIRDELEDDIYIFGEISNWEIDDNFLMTYDSTTHSYKNSILLKQGYYNYLYVTKNQNSISTRRIEGAHFDSNNEYIIKVYYHDPLELYDRLLAYQVFKVNT